MSEKCEGCVHQGQEDGHNSNFMGCCEYCVRNPNLSDYYTNEKEFESQLNNSEWEGEEI